ncbi:MAG: hypothetical protein C0417_11815 [Chlorobiaceae bacterium]|nr:hypothetical protein [Chlorobiaceae bacterium]
MKKLMFLLVAVLLVSLSAMSQVQGVYDYTVTGAGLGLVLEGGTVAAGPLYSGVCYEIVPDPQGITLAGGITPITNDELAEIAPVTLTGDAYANVMVSCAVPTLLLSSDGFAPLGLTYTATSGFADVSGDGTVGLFFNPTAGAIDINLNADGNAFIWIGFNACAPKFGAAAAEWTGQAMISAQYK